MPWYEDLEYQLMCEEAEKLQNKAKKEAKKTPPKSIISLGNTKVDVDDHGRFWKGDFIRGSATRIFSQEDLQEIVSKHFKNKNGLDSTFHLVNEFRDFVIKFWDHYWHALPAHPSMNQLCLAFVMHELYQKKWNPESKRWEKQ